MNFSEKVLEEILNIKEEKKCDNLIEAMIIFCEEHDFEPESLIEQLDNQIIEQIKYDAIKNHLVRKSVAKIDRELF